MKILVINTGSSSIKYRLFEMDGQDVLAWGLLEKIGETTSLLTHNVIHARENFVKEGPVPDHRTGMHMIVELLTDHEQGVIHDTAEIDAVGHRVVHGRESFHQPALIDDKVLMAVKSHAALAPLHNPPNLVGIETARYFFPDTPQVAVFDTAFHQTIPEHAFHYALPHDLYEQHGVRRYGFHGTSHQYVAKQAAQYLDKPLSELDLITIHLGNGASITAIKNGCSVDTSMGMTPLEGLLMGTRSGDIDPGIIFYLGQQLKMSMGAIDALLNKQSGLLGICRENDMREILKRKGEGDHKAGLAIEMYTYRIKKYIGAYLAALGRADAIVFTGGIGEHAVEIRQAACRGLEQLGVAIDPEKNKECARGLDEISSPEGRVKILVIPTNEELEIALQTAEVLQGKS